jgi:hypothetical protein
MIASFTKVSGEPGAAQTVLATDRHGPAEAAARRSALSANSNANSVGFRKRPAQRVGSAEPRQPPDDRVP